MILNMFILQSKDLVMNDNEGNKKFSSFFEIEQVPNSRGLYEFVRWIEEGGIELSPDFQREYVWSKQKASLLVESFLMNIPVPSIFMYIQDGKRHIIDGKQRLETIRRFIKNEWVNGEQITQFALEFENDEDEEDNPRQGKTIDSLTTEDKKRLSDAYLMAITIRPTSEDENRRMDSIYYIFERLNTGGVSLTPTEIRLSIWNKLALLQDIKELSNDATWKASIKISKKHEKENKSYPAHERAESILKIIALAKELQNYSAPMKDFLTKFLKKSSKENIDYKNQITNLNELINDKAIQTFLKPYLSKKNIIIESFYTALLIAKENKLPYNISNGDIFKNNVFTKQGGTAQKSTVINRIKLIYKELTGQLIL